MNPSPCSSLLISTMKLEGGSPLVRSWDEAIAIQEGSSKRGARSSGHGGCGSYGRCNLSVAYRASGDR